MKLHSVGDLMVDGRPVRGVFVECSVQEIASIMRRANLYDEVSVTRAEETQDTPKDT